MVVLISIWYLMDSTMRLVVAMMHVSHCLCLEILVHQGGNVIYGFLQRRNSDDDECFQNPIGQIKDEVKLPKKKKKKREQRGLEY